MSNRTDFDNQAAEFLYWMRSAPADEAQDRLERELNDAFVAGQEHEDRGLRAALAEALTGWERCEIEVITSTNGSTLTAIEMANSESLARIAELRAKFLGGK